MTIVQRSLLPVDEHCYIMDSTNALLFKAPYDLKITATPVIDSWTHDTYSAANDYSINLGWRYTGEFKIAEYDEYQLNNMFGGTRTATTAGIAFVDEDLSVVANAATLSYTPYSSNMVHVFSPSSLDTYNKGSVASTNVFSIAGSNLTFSGVGTTTLKARYWRTMQTAVKNSFSPFNVPPQSGFGIVVAKRVVYKGAETKDYIVFYAKNCVITDAVDFGAKEISTIKFKINNVLTDDWVLYRPYFSNG